MTAHPSAAWLQLQQKLLVLWRLRKICKVTFAAFCWCKPRVKASLNDSGEGQGHTTLPGRSSRNCRGRLKGAREKHLHSAILSSGQMRSTFCAHLWCCVLVLRDPFRHGYESRLVFPPSLWTLLWGGVEPRFSTFLICLFPNMEEAWESHFMAIK